MHSFRLDMFRLAEQACCIWRPDRIQKSGLAAYNRGNFFAARVRQKSAGIVKQHECLYGIFTQQWIRRNLTIVCFWACTNISTVFWITDPSHSFRHRNGNSVVNQFLLYNVIFEMEHCKIISRLRYTNSWTCAEQKYIFVALIQYYLCLENFLLFDE